MEFSEALTRRVMSTFKRPVPLIDLEYVIKGNLQVWTAFRLLNAPEYQDLQDVGLLNLIAQLLYLPYAENLHHYIQLEGRKPRISDLKEVAYLPRHRMLWIAKRRNDVHLLDFYRS